MIIELLPYMSQVNHKLGINNSKIIVNQKVIDVELNRLEKNVWTVIPCLLIKEGIRTVLYCSFHRVLAPFQCLEGNRNTIKIGEF